MRFEVCLVVHLSNIFDPVPQINELYSFLHTKVNKVQYVIGSGTSFTLCRIEIKKYNIKPGCTQIDDCYTNQSGPYSVADLNCIGYVVQEKTVIIIKGRTVTSRISGSK